MRHLLVLLGALALGGCDGGIFGTGDGSSDVIVPGADAGPVGNGMASIGAPDGGAITAPGESDGGGTDGAGASSAGDTGEDVSASGELDGGTAFPPGAGTPTSALRNLVTEPGIGDGPRVRLVNLGTRPLTLATGLGDVSASGASSGPIPPGGASSYVTLPAGAGSLWMTRDEGVPGTVADHVPLHRFAPLALAPSSVTSVFVREAPAGSADDGDIDFVALPTRLASDDPGQAMVRVVDGMPTVSEDGRFRLVPDGAVNPGGVEVALEMVRFDRPSRPVDTVAPAYVPVPVGDYRLVDTGGALADAPLSFAGGDVRTLVVIAADGPPVVVDDDRR